MVAACGGGGGNPEPTSDTQPQNQPPSTSQPLFSDVTGSSGIDFVNDEVELRDPAAMIADIAPSAVAAGDYDNDGDIDLFIVRGDVQANLLYRNQGNLVFEEIAASAGLAYTKSATEGYRHSATMFADLDGDRDLDLFVGGLDGDPSFVFANNGDGTFSDVTAGSGIDTLAALNNVSAAFGDYDLDGDLDLFISHWGTSRDIASVGRQHLWN